VDSHAGGRVDLHHLGVGQERAVHMVGHIKVGELAPLVVEAADLRERHQAAAHAQQLQDAQVLLRLGLPALGGSHDEQAGVDRSHSRQHVLDEPNVAGHVDERQLGPRRQPRRGEAQIDREAALAFLGQPVGVGPGQRLDEGGLAVVDVTSGGENVH
jgi:hypothetical protein